MPVDLFGKTLSCAKRHLQGTHRARRPDETLDAYRPLMRKLGITRLANVTGLDTIGIPVCVAIRPNARSLATSQGKGLDLDSAKASALMESIEMWHAEHLALPIRRESYTVLARETAVADPLTLPRSPGTVFAPSLRRLWVHGYDIAQKEAVWIPHELVCIDEVDPDGALTFAQDSNGLASGNDTLEAIVHALCEVIERDAEAMWRAGDDMTRIDTRTIDDPYAREALRRIEAAGVHCVVWDITSDVGVPTYACGLIDPPGSSLSRGTGFFDGFGCHLSPAIALSRAITEAAQTRLTYIAGNRDDIFREDYADLVDEDSRTELWEEMTNDDPMNAFARENLSTDTFDGDVERLVRALAAVGARNVIVTDLTRAEIGIPVVKVVVPGLEGAFSSASPGPRAKRVEEGRS